MGAGLVENVKEVRHGRISIYLGAHLTADLPVDAVSLASGVFQFNGTSPASHRRLQELSRGFASVSIDQVAALAAGQAYGAFRRASNGLYAREAQLYNFRPSCIEAGGQTLTME